MGTSQGAPGMFVQSRRALGGWRGGKALPLPVTCLSATLNIHICVDTTSPAHTPAACSCPGENARSWEVHTVKGFGIVNKAEIDVFLELSWFFDDQADVGNLISGSSAFSKTSLIQKRSLIKRQCTYRLPLILT